MNPKRNGEAGLSMVEVLVSLAIFAVIGIAGLAVLNTVARTGERTEGRLERLAEIDRTFLIIRRDLAQIMSPTVNLDAQNLAFQRMYEDKSLKLAYHFKNTVLVRQIDVSAAQPVQQQLLTGISSAEWRLMDRGRQWHTVWPPTNQESKSAPIAAELTLNISRPDIPTPQSVTRLIVLPAGQGR